MIQFINVSKIFGTGLTGLSDITLSIDKGEFVFLVGPTGSGKTTLFKLLIKDMIPTKGDILISGFDIGKLPSKKVAHLRKKIGVIFQDLKLLMDGTIFENVLLPLQIAGVNTIDSTKRAREVLENVGIIAHKDKFPVQLSGGELQRVAIARALSLSPEILLADEPTGNLDNKTAFEIIDVLTKINQSGTTVMMATHNMDIVNKLEKRIIGLEKGRVINDTKVIQKKKGKNDTT